MGVGRQGEDEAAVDRSKRQMGSFLSQQNYLKYLKTLKRKTSQKEGLGFFGLMALGVGLWFRCADFGPVVRLSVMVVANEKATGKQRQEGSPYPSEEHFFSDVIPCNGLSPECSLPSQ